MRSKGPNQFIYSRITHRGSPVRAQSGQGHVPLLKVVDFANQRLKCAEPKRYRFGAKSVRHMSTVDLRDQQLRWVGQTPVRIELGKGIWTQNYLPDEHLMDQTSYKYRAVSCSLTSPFLSKQSSLSLSLTPWFCPRLHPIPMSPSTQPSHLDTSGPPFPGSKCRMIRSRRRRRGRS